MSATLAGVALAKLMTKVDCRGGNTQIGRVLSHVKAEAGKGTIKAVIFVGDAFEEGVDALCQKAGEIGLLGVPLFMFQEGNDVTAATAFKQIAKLTRGAYYKLDEKSPQVLAELLGAVAAYATGGRVALESRSDQAARALLLDLAEAAATEHFERLLELQTGESYGPEDYPSLEFPINPERVAPVLPSRGPSHHFFANGRR